MILLFLLQIIFRSVYSVDLKKPLSELCDKYTSSAEGFFDKVKNERVTFDAINEFSRGIKLGEGSFGVVKRVQYPSDEGTLPIALKEVNSKNSNDSQMIAKELAALEALNDSNYSPKFYGCSIRDIPDQGHNRPAHSKIYIALELLSRGLESSTFKSHILNISKKDSLILFSHMFKGIKDMNDKGLAHNDIKPENMMTNSDMSRVYLIDLGLASSSTETLFIAGTPLFMSPSKFSSTGIFPTYKPKDDFYSIAVSIADLISKKKDEVFSKPGQYGVSRECIKNGQFELTLACQKTIFENVKRILSGHGYGLYTMNATKDNINLTTLIANMVAYNDFTLSVEDVLSVIDRLILASPDPVLQSVRKYKESVQNQEFRIGGLEKEKRRIEEELRVKKEQQQKYLQEQEALKLEASGKHDELIEIEKNIYKSKQKYKQEAGEDYKKALQAKREAEQLIKNIKTNDKIHYQNEAFHIYKFNPLVRVHPQNRLNEPVVSPFFAFDPILAYYKVQEPSKYNLLLLVGDLKLIKLETQISIDQMNKQSFDEVFTANKLAEIKKQEQIKVKMSLEKYLKFKNADPFFVINQQRKPLTYRFQNINFRPPFHII